VAPLHGFKVDGGLCTYAITRTRIAKPPYAKIWGCHNYANPPVLSDSSLLARLTDAIMNVMIVDDHAGVRNMIRQLLAAPGDRFVECATGEAAVRTAREFKPDYVTMDVRLPDLSGLEAARAIRDIHPPSRVIIVTSYDQPFLRQTASEVGAIAYVLKDNLAELRSVLVAGARPATQSGSTGGQAPESARTRNPSKQGSQDRPSTTPIASSNGTGPKPEPSTPARIGHPLRVLLVEDSENDYELILRQLKRCGFTPRARRVDTATELRRALEQDAWDIIITDHILPTFSGAEALALIRDTGANIPTLCVTGSADPAKIAEVLNAGACAIINKDDLAPLCAAVTSALNRRAAQSDPSGRSTSGGGAAE
jgi:DNA-binding NarL/FixJ family response regulator